MIIFIILKFNFYYYFNKIVKKYINIFDTILIKFLNPNINSLILIILILNNIKYIV